MTTLEFEGEWKYDQIKRAFFIFLMRLPTKEDFKSKFHGKGVVRFRPNYSQHFHFVAVWHEGALIKTPSPTTGRSLQIQTAHTKAKK